MTATTGRAEGLGVRPGDAVQEIGWDSDCDEDLRTAISEASGTELLDEDSHDVVNVILLWFREEDGDLADALMDAIVPLADNGTIWLLTPKNGREGHIEAADIAEAAPIAGLQQTSTISAAPEWQGTRLVSPRSKR